MCIHTNTVLLNIRIMLDFRSLLFNIGKYIASEFNLRTIDLILRKLFYFIDFSYSLVYENYSLKIL